MRRFRSLVLSITATVVCVVANADALAQEAPARYPFRADELWTIHTERTTEARTKVTLANGDEPAMESRLVLATDWTWKIESVAEDGSATALVSVTSARLESAAAGTAYVVSTKAGETSETAPQAIRDRLTNLATMRFRGVVDARGKWRSLTPVAATSDSDAASDPPSPPNTPAETLSADDVAGLPLLPESGLAVGASEENTRTVTTTNGPTTLNGTLTRVRPDEPKLVSANGENAIDPDAILFLSSEKPAPPTDSDATASTDVAPRTAFTSQGFTQFTPDKPTIVTARQTTAVTRVTRRGAFNLTTQSSSMTATTATRNPAK